MNGGVTPFCAVPESSADAEGLVMGSGGSPSLGAVSGSADVPTLLFTMSQGLGVLLKWGDLLTLTRPETVQPSGQSQPVASEEGLVWRRGKQV